MAPEEQEAIIPFLHDLIQEAAPNLKPHLAYNMLGYGSIERPIVTLANQKHHMSMYVCAIVEGQHIAEKHQKGLGKVSVDGSRIRFNRLEDVNLPLLKKVIHARPRSQVW